MSISSALQNNSDGACDGVLRVLEAIGSSLELRQVLYRVVDAVVETTGAERALILLYEDGALVPAAVGARRANADLFQQFRRMPSIHLDDVPLRRQAFEAGEIFVIDDMSNSPLVPEAWIEAFGPQALAIAPLVVGPDRLGLLVVDHEVPHEFTDAELRVVRATAHAARIAIRDAQVHSTLAKRVEMQRELVRTLTRIGPDVALPDTLRHVVETVSLVFDGRPCSISLDGEVVTNSAESVRVDWSSRASTMIPLRAGPTFYGYLIVGGGPLMPDEVETIEAFGHQAALAIDRSAATGEVSRLTFEAEAAKRLADVLLARGSNGLTRTIERLNDAVCRAAGFECYDVGFRRQRLADLLGCRKLDRDELVLTARLNAEDPRAVAQVHPDGRHAAPIVVNGRSAGLLFVRPVALGAPMAEGARGLVRSLADHIGDVAHEVRLESARRQAELRLELELLRSRLTERVDATLGRTLRLLGRELSNAIARSREARGVGEGDLATLLSLVTRGLMEAHTASSAVAELGVREDGLVHALRHLIDVFAHVTGTSATLRVVGVPRALPLEFQEHAYGITFDALWAVERWGRATAVVLSLRCQDGTVEIVLRDDGVGLAQRRVEEPGPGVHFGIGSIRDRVAKLGGAICVEAVEPRGIQLAVSLPV